MQSKFKRIVGRSLCVVFCLAIVFSFARAYAQTTESIADLKQKVAELARQTKYTDALPLLEKIVAVEPDNAEMRFLLGFALVAQANTTKDATVEKQLRVRARDEFIKSKELGNNHPLVDAMIQSMTEDGSLPDDVLRDEVATRAELTKVAKAPSITAVFDYNITKKNYAQLKASGWQPAR